MIARDCEGPSDLVRKPPCSGPLCAEVAKQMGWSDTVCEKATWSLSWHISRLILSSPITLKSNCASKFLGCRTDPIRIVLSDNKIEPTFSARSAAFSSENHVH